MKFHLFLGLLYIFPNNLHYGIEPMLIKFAINVKAE